MNAEDPYESMPQLSAEQAKRWHIEDARTQRDAGLETESVTRILEEAEAEKEELPDIDTIEWKVIQLPTVTPRSQKPFSGYKGRNGHASQTTGRIKPRYTGVFTQVDKYRD